MTEEQYHVHDLLAAYVLGAVTILETMLVEEHLVTCALCRRQESEFREVERLLPLLAGELAPPPTLKTRLMSIVEAEPHSRDSADTALGETREAEPVAPIAAVAPRRSTATPVRWSAARRLSPILAMAAVLTLALLGAGLWLTLGGGTQRPTHTYAVASTAPGQQDLGTLAYYQDGKRLELTLHGLTKTDASHVYELWLIRVQGGKPVAVKGVQVFRAPDGTGHLSAAGQDIRGYNAAGLTVEKHFSPNKPTLPIVAKAAI